MAIVHIDIPDEQAATLVARADAEGKTLKRFIEDMVAAQTSPRRRTRYTAAELVAQYDGNAALTEEDRAWLAAPPIGREVL